MVYKYIRLAILLSMGFAASCAIPATSSVIASAPTVVAQPSSTNSPTITLPPATLTMTATPRLIPTTPPVFPSRSPNTPTGSIFFPIGPGFSDVIPHQIVRTNTDRIYVFAGVTYSTTLHAYWTTAPGLPNGTSDFNGSAQVTESGIPMAVDAVYDGGNIIHVFIITQNSGQVKDYPFDLSSNTFKPPIIVASDSHTLAGDYIGTSGVSGMMDKTGSILHVAYWTNANHIKHGTFTYNSTTNKLSPVSDLVQVDSNGSANHPSIAISPTDNSLTVTWVSEADNPVKIRARTRASNGTWGAIESVSTAPVWTSTNMGINIDQGPSLVIDANGTKLLTYIENYDATNDYGHIHYVTNNGSSWSDQAVGAYTHDPALALNRGGEIYIIGHGHPQDINSACLSMEDMCTIKKNSASTFGLPQLFATHPNTLSFDSSPSVKWSVVGWNRPESIEFLFFATPYGTPTLYYGRLAASSSILSLLYLPLVLRLP